MISSIVLESELVIKM